MYLITCVKGFKCRAINAASESHRGVVNSIIPVFSQDHFPGCNRKVIRPLENSVLARVGGLKFPRYQPAKIIIFNNKDFVGIGIDPVFGFQSLSAQECGENGHIALQETRDVKVHILGLLRMHTYLHVQVRS